MGRVFPEPQGLEGDASNDKFGYPCYFAHLPPQSKICHSSGDSQMKNMGEPIPFSLNPRHPYVVKDDRVKNGIYAKELDKPALGREEEAQKFRDPFYKDTGWSGSVSENEDLGWTCHLPGHPRSHVLQTAGVAPCGSYDPFQRGVGKYSGVDAFSQWACASDPYLGYPESSGAAEPHMPHEEAVRDRAFPFLPLTYDTMREENATLRKMVQSMKSSLERREAMVQRLEEQLNTRLAEEERKAQELQAFAQKTARSLQLMTQRALEAESNTEKLKKEIFILRGELERSKEENESLRASQATNLNAMKYSIDFTLQSLQRIITGANWSIKQLVSGVNSLHFITEVLKSTGKISEGENQL
ncbi:PREDICTED: serologically defined colon cancer antigen 3-like [Eurypyga helias]|uniref:serologically defined colon cancer antigen 3-like n=1 Tax=Eurypyga helias TaxID=54383 RepID=UPI0005282E9E|nr:PREDICTED: serologically defined colon cancer antigen 3-like [Eurypyga helias]